MQEKKLMYFYTEFLIVGTFCYFELIVFSEREGEVRSLCSSQTKKGSETSRLFFLFSFLFLLLTIFRALLRTQSIFAYVHRTTFSPFCSSIYYFCIYIR